MHATSINPVLNVTDVAASIAWFESLGWVRNWTWNQSGSMGFGPQSPLTNAGGPATFASVGSGECSIFLCQGGQGSRGRLPTHTGDEGTGGVWMSVWVKTLAEVDEAYERAKAAGIAINQPPTNEPWGVRECKLTHPDGHTLRVSCGFGKAL